MSGEDGGSNHILLILFTILFTLLMIANAYFYQNVDCMANVAKFLPNASSNIILGMIVGGILSLTDVMDEEFSFDEEFFFLVMLPPIIFASGFKVRKDYFFYNFGTILTYAFAGTAIATFVISCLLYWLSAYTYKLELNECLIFASLISAIDPVATIVTMHAAGVGGRLYALIFGEAVLNDAVAIVINNVFLEVAEEDKNIVKELAIAIPKILLITVASILIGLLVSAGAAYMFKKKPNLKKNHVLEVFLFFLLGIVPYMICESTHGWLSGIMAILFSGIFFDYYTFYHLSGTGKSSVKVIVHMMEFIFESFIFFFLGAALWDKKNKWHAGLFFLTLFSCLVGRAAAIFPITWIVNLSRKPERKISLNESVMMWFSGLRGPVSFALAFKISSKAVPLEDDRNAIITASLLVIWVTTFVLGGASNSMLSCLNLLGIKEQKNFVESNHWFRRLDKKYMKPFGCDDRDFKERHDLTMFSVTRYGFNQRGSAKPKEGLAGRNIEEIGSANVPRGFKCCFSRTAKPKEGLAGNKALDAIVEQNIEEMPASESTRNEDSAKEIEVIYLTQTTRSDAL